MKMSKLAEKRKEKGFTQEELAKKLGLNNKTISRYERGERNPSLDAIGRIAEVLDCTINDLI